jgi:hypothetical protein
VDFIRIFEAVEVSQGHVQSCGRSLAETDWGRQENLASSAKGFVSHGGAGSVEGAWKLSEPLKTTKKGRSAVTYRHSTNHPTGKCPLYLQCFAIFQK